jgi:putative FmdB family regulatory protein
MILYDFKCQCGNEFEGLVKMSDKTHQCERCGSEAIRLISTPNIRLEGTTGDFPTANARWTRIHEEEAKRTTSE